jgi:hypothetical protein
MLLLLVLVLLGSAPAAAQVAPDLHWSTLRTEHFRVHFSDGLEPVARRAAGSIERAYASLARELHEPRGTIDLVVADNVDFSNGYATTFPSNRIVIYARPPVDADAPQFLDDWIDLVVTHELTHIFHLDRARGWWRLGQWVFGRNPFLFPNDYSPSWLAEGIAVYYESRLTGAGRVEGTDVPMVVRAKAIDGATPPFTSLSLANPSYPLGGSVYAYGSLLVDFIARTRGTDKLRTFIERSAQFPVPFFLNTNARAAFGVSFDSAFSVFGDSVNRAALAAIRALPAERDLTARGWYTMGLRWVDGTHLVYANNDGRGSTSMKEVSTTDGVPRTIERMNSTDIVSPIGGARVGAQKGSGERGHAQHDWGERVYAQRDWIDPYTYRSDLYFDAHGTTRRLTTGARLLQPDARFLGPVVSPHLEIVAVQLLPAASRLVVVRPVADSVAVTPITGASLDTVWTSPRWSHDGARIVAVRWIRGGITELAILDAAGHLLTTFGRTRALNSAPAWAAGDSAVYFTSDRTGRSTIYRASLPSGSLTRVAEAATGLFESEPSPDGTQLATLHFRGDGFHIALLPLGRRLPPADTGSVLAPSRYAPPPRVDARAESYSPWLSLLPRYWLPVAEQSDQQRTMWGFLTGGSDVLARHEYGLQVTVEPRRGEPSGTIAYRYAGFGNPTVEVNGQEVWDHFGLVDSTRAAVGTLARRKRIADVALTFDRPRTRTAAHLSVGAEMEWRDFDTDPSTLFGGLDPLLRKVLTYPAFFASAGWSNTRRPLLGISPEDGISLAASVRQRWRSDVASDTRSTSLIGAASAYKSLDLPGYAHHVLALRAAGGWADEKTSKEFQAGGVSGSTVQIVPGVAVGDGRRTFFARGFPASSQIGSRALAASAEYRLPLSLPMAGVLQLPVFLQKTSAVVFTDAATAWCPVGLANSAVCPKATPRAWMASAGAELQLAAAMQYDVPVTFRVGAAVPTAGRRYFGKSGMAAFFSVGLAF